MYRYSPDATRILKDFNNNTAVLDAYCELFNIKKEDVEYKHFMNRYFLGCDLESDFVDHYNERYKKNESYENIIKLFKKKKVEDDYSDSFYYYFKNNDAVLQQQKKNRHYRISPIVIIIE